MTAPALHEQPHWFAVRALIDEPGSPVFDEGEVPGLDGNPGATPLHYVVLAIERRFVDTRRLVGLADSSGWRVMVEVVAPTAATVRARVARISAALEGQRLTVDGHASTPIQHDSPGDLRRVGAQVYREASWTYAL